MYSVHVKYLYRAVINFLLVMLFDHSQDTKHWTKLQFLVAVADMGIHVVFLVSSMVKGRYL